MSEQGRTPLHEAVLQGHDCVVELLLRAGVDAQRPTRGGTVGLTAAVLAQQRGHDHIAEMLTLTRGELELLDAAKQEPLTANARAKRLLEAPEHNTPRPLHLEKTIRYGQTALYLFAKHNNAAGVQLLLEHRASIDALDMNCKGPLHWAAEHGNEVMLAHLLAQEPHTDPDTDPDLDPHPYLLPHPLSGLRHS